MTFAKVPAVTLSVLVCLILDLSTAVAKLILFADLFTRGIDVQAVNVVINFDFPYVRRMSTDDYFLFRAFLHAFM